ncbi:MAG: alkaline phosphatase [Planctomycetaceae bacterium]|nr:alkaline phosphatase [Planctomycetaceae bacterium]
MKRRVCVLHSLLLIGAAAVTQAAGPFQADGIKIGEVDQTSSIVWTRTTADAQANPSVENAAPGAEGEVRVTCWQTQPRREVFASGWKATDPLRDFTRQFGIKDLSPAAAYEVLVETRPVGGSDATSRVEGRFRTAPAPEAVVPVEFVVVTCQAIRSADCGDNGHSPYKLIPKLDADFFVHTGDVVYYDNPPNCKDAEHARWKWNRMYGFFYNRDFHAGVASYFMKDDHDTVKNDCWPGQSYGDLTWEQGLAIFREQVPMGEKTYRTVRWGKDVQIWMTENRDFRSPNKMPDGPEKTIWGTEQKAWFKRTVAESDATFRFLIMPGPLLGPDKRGKADNHSNDCFKHEGDEIRDFVARQKNMFVINGDRHWQYFSIHPELGIREFGCGPINDLHDYGGNPGFVPEYHRFFNGGGGWLTVTVSRRGDRPQATARWYKTSPEMEEPEVRYETTFAAE